MNKKALLITAVLILVLAACGVPSNPFLAEEKEPVKKETVKEVETTGMYTIVISMIDNEEGDSVTAAPKTARHGETVTLNCNVASTIQLVNYLKISGVNRPIAPVDKAGSATRTYTVNAKDADENGVITIIAAFMHTLKLPEDIVFTNTSPHIRKVYGDDPFTNAIDEIELQGTGEISYSSDTHAVATVDPVTGEVTIHKVGTAIITAHKAADETYAHLPAVYTLEVDHKPVTITVTVANKVYNGNESAFVNRQPVVNGMVEGDTVTCKAGTIRFEDKNVGDDKAVICDDWELTGADAGNYKLIAQPGTTANITPRPLYARSVTIELSPIQTTAAITVSDFVSGDTAVDFTSSGIPTGITYNSTTRMLTYNGTQSFSNPNEIFNGTLNPGTNYTPSSFQVTVSLEIYDGQVNYTGSGFDRRIPVSQANITSFNSYAGGVGLNKHYKLMQNVTLTGTNNWTAIGTKAAPFTGSFDGQGYTITGLNIDRPTADFQGMFGSFMTGDVIKNLGLIDASITGRDFVGGIVGNNDSTVENCFVLGGTVSTLTGSTTGGIVGQHYGTVRNCYATNEISGGDYVGGIVGFSDVGFVQNCVALNSSVTGGTGGRVVGEISDSTGSGVLRNNHASTNMTTNKTTFNKGLATIDGQDVSPGTATNQYNSQSFWTTTSYWYSAAWDLTNVWQWDTTLRLPVLKMR